MYNKKRRFPPGMRRFFRYQCALQRYVQTSRRRYACAVEPRTMFFVSIPSIYAISFVHAA
jgi:hypothetical protein